MVMRSTRGVLPTPTEMDAHLDLHVHGQQRAKRDLAAAVYAHYMGKALLNDAESAAEGIEDVGRQHVLLLGPTGSGKTHMVRTLAALLDVPVMHASATSLVETGYVGEPVESLVRGLYAHAGTDCARAERGIVYLDEIDKLRRAQEVSRDVSGEGVQNGLLTLLDGRRVPVRRDMPQPEVDSARILFVCTGAFVGLEQIVAAREGRTLRVGFSESVSRSALPAPAEQIAPEDLVRFGLIPELVGRFATITTLEALELEDLVRILTHTRGSVLARQRAFYRLHGLELVVEPEALQAIAVRARATATGARALARELLTCLRATTARLPELVGEGVGRVCVHAGCVNAGELPRLEQRNGPNAQERVRRLRAAALGRPAQFAEPWSPAIARQPYDRIVLERLGWSRGLPASRLWWSAVEAEGDNSPGELLRLIEELARTRMTIDGLHAASQRAGTSDLKALVLFLEFERRRRQAEVDRVRKEAREEDSSTSEDGGTSPGTDTPQWDPF